MYKHFVLILTKDILISFVMAEEAVCVKWMTTIIGRKGLEQWDDDNESNPNGLLTSWPYNL